MGPRSLMRTTRAAATAGLLALACQSVPASTSGSVAVDQQLRTIDHSLHDGRYAEAEVLAHTTLAALDAEGSGDSREAALLADRLVEALLLGHRGLKPEAIAVARRAVALNERSFGAMDAETGRSLDRLGRVLTTREEYDEATIVLQRALLLLEDELGPGHTDVATARSSTGLLLLSQRKLDEALAWFEQSREIRENVLGGDDPTVGETEQMIGTCLSLQGNFQGAYTHLRRALEIYEQALGPVHPRVAEALESLGVAQGFNDELVESQLSLERALRIVDATAGPDSAMAAPVLSDLGYTHLAAAEWTKASRYFERSLAIHVRESGEHNRLAASELLALGIVRNDMGDAAGAAAFEARAVAILEQAHGPWHPELGRALRHLGVSLTNLGRFAEAEPVMLRALAIAEKNFGSDSPVVGNALRSIGDHYSDRGEYDKARSYSLRALAIYEKLESPGQTSTGVAYILGDLARSSRGLGDPEGALDYAGRGLKLHESALGPAHPDNAVYLVDIARLLFETGQHDAGRAAARRADEIIREHLIRTAHVASEEQALAYASARPPAVDLLITVAAGSPERAEAAVIAAWDSAIRSRGQVLDSMIERRHLLVESRDPELADLVGALRRATERLAKLVVQGPGGLDEQAYRATLESASREKERTELALAERSAEQRGKLARSRAGLAEVAAALPPQTALVAFVRYGRLDLTTRQGDKPQPLSQSTPAFAAFILSSASAVPVVVPLADAAAVDTLVARWRTTTAREALAGGRAAKAGEASYQKVAEELRRALWDPIASHLGAAQQVFIVPDGTLNVVSLAALPTGDGRYLIETGLRVHYLSAERDLASPDNAGSRGGLVALSNPDFNDRRLFTALGPRQVGEAPVTAATTAALFRGSRSACGSFQSMRFEALPASARETSEIVRLWGDESSALSFTGPAANETTFKQTAGGHRVLHLATHGFFLGEDCGSASDAPAAGGTSPASRTVTRENPLLLSGLVLAGANHRDAAGADEDDGILTAEEIATLDLQGTEWAVLSACDTGTGEIRAGEGVFGLRRAFQLAGAHTVIMSLWPVEDEATRQWMTALYRHRFVEGKFTAASVNDASLELLQQRRARGESTHPFYWAGFIAAGAWR